MKIVDSFFVKWILIEYWNINSVKILFVLHGIMVDTGQWKLVDSGSTSILQVDKSKHFSMIILWNHDIQCISRHRIWLFPIHKRQEFTALQKMDKIPQNMNLSEEKIHMRKIDKLQIYSNFINFSSFSNVTVIQVNSTTQLWPKAPRSTLCKHLLILSSSF